jgi:hypothetical protein
VLAVAPPRTPASKHSTSVEDPQPQDLESPFPPRTEEQQNQLTKTLLELPTLAERLTYLMEHESTAFLHRGEYVFDVARIEANLEQIRQGTYVRGGRLVQKHLGGPAIAEFVSTRTGLSFRKQTIYQFRNGERTKLRTEFSNAMSVFWQIDPRLLDPTVPTSHFETAQDASTQLDEVERRTLELMNEIGFVGVKAREVKQTLGDTSVTGKHAFVGILEGIARERNARTDTEPPSTP